MKYVFYGFIALFALVIAGLVGTLLRVASTPSRVISEVVSTQNVLSSYDEFFALNARFQTRVSDISAQKLLISTEVDPDQRRIQQTNLLAVQSACRDLVTQYNASAINKTSSWFRDGALPPSLMISDCE